MRLVCDDYAAKGYIAVCPDLFWRQGTGDFPLASPESGLKDALARYQAYDTEAGVRDLLATMAYLRMMQGCLGKIGAVGYGLGGKMAWLAATRSDVDCAVSYYGLGMESVLDEVHDIRNPLLLHVAGHDEFTTAAVQERLLAIPQQNPEVSVFMYPDASHAFARPDSLTYRPEEARLADERTVTFLEENLF